MERLMEFLASEKMPASLLRWGVANGAKLIHALLKTKLKTYKENFLFDDLYIVDACHGGIPLWDWMLLEDGGLWFQYFWPVVINTILDRSECYSLNSVLEIDGYMRNPEHVDHSIRSMLSTF